MNETTAYKLINGTKLMSYNYSTQALYFIVVLKPLSLRIEEFPSIICLSPPPPPPPLNKNK